jgi:hypothetical protein
VTQTVLNLAPSRTRPQPWLSSPTWDCLLILSPAFISSLVALALSSHFDGSQDLPLWAWVSFVLLVDVAHVYSTLFRTYLDPVAFARNRGLLLAIPAVCWGLGCLLYSIDALLFWKALAYLAVFHFIRQQYGFAALYSRKDPPTLARYRWIDHACIYLSTLYPLLYWHTHLPRPFNWFIEGDFIESVPHVVASVALVMYIVLAAAYIFKELFFLKTTAFFNIPKNLIITGTALSWWVGIVMLNSDMAFTMTNVLTHGIPYMGLIWLYHRNLKPELSLSSTGESAKSAWMKVKSFALTYAPAFVIFLAVLAYLEEGIWDGFVWREHLAFFAPFAHLPTITDASVLAVLIPLLSLPQSTHYVLDGFIWRVKDKSSTWSV